MVWGYHVEQQEEDENEGDEEGILDAIEGEDDSDEEEDLHESDEEIGNPQIYD